MRPPVVRETMELAPLAFDYTVVNTASNFSRSTLIALEMANSIVMPITPDMAAMKSAVNTMRATRGETHAVDTCPGCGAALSGGWGVRRVQVIDLPPVAPLDVTQHRILRRHCPRCGNRVLPPPVGREAGRTGQCRFGPRLHATIVTMATVERLPGRIIQERRQREYGLRISHGGNIGLLQRAAREGTAVYELLQADVRASPVVHADETGWRESGFVSTYRDALTLDVARAMFHTDPIDQIHPHSHGAFVMLPPRLILCLSAAILAVGALFLPASPSVLAAHTLTVTTTGDDAQACTAQHCSFRSALTQAQADGSGDTIAFRIPASDPGCSGSPAVCTIYPSSALPAITESHTVIDGYTQPFAHPNSNAPVARRGGDTAVILIQIDGTLLTSGSPYGLHVQGGQNTIRGLAVNNFPAAVYLDGSGATGNVLAGNFLGIGPDGHFSGPLSSQGVAESAGNGAHAGGNTIGGAQPALANLLVGAYAGVSVADHDGTLIQGNFIGTDAAGTGLGRSGRPPFGSANCVSLERTDAVRVLGNLIAGCDGDEVIVYDSNRPTLAGNLIGTSVFGNAELGGALSAIDVIHGTGARIQGNVLDAGTRAGVATAEFGAVMLEGTDSTTIQGNFIGTDATGKQVLGSVGDGISAIPDLLSGNYAPTSNLTIGGGPGQGNVISGNSLHGIFLQGVAGVRIEHNHIGTDVTNQVSVPNAGVGIQVQPYHGSHVVPSSQVTIGSASRGNIISANRGGGISLTQVQGSVIQGNLIGVDSSTDHALGNGGNGILTEAGTGLVVGGSGAGQGNVIDANDGVGMFLAGVSGAVIQGNVIGTNLSHTLPLGNRDAGINVSGTAQIGGPDTGSAPNVIAFNHSAGVGVSGPNSHVSIERNAIFRNGRLGIGLDFDGSWVPKDASGGSIHCSNAPQSNGGRVCPLVYSATTSTISGAAPLFQRVEVFLASPGAGDLALDSHGSPAHFGEGRVYLGSTSAHFLAGHRLAWYLTVPQNIKLKPGDYVTATVTDSNGNTSEFAEDVRVTG